MSFAPVEVWIDVFEKHGLFEAIKNVKKLEEY